MAIALCLVAERAINVLIPLQVGHVTNMLTRGDGNMTMLPVFAINANLKQRGFALEANFDICHPPVA